LPIAQTKDAPNLVEQGRAFYEAGQYTEAIRVLQQSLDRKDQEGDSFAPRVCLQQAMLWSNLSLNYQQLGQ
jgi:tetratricopeptide (TPR) repeat protein